MGRDIVLIVRLCVGMCISIRIYVYRIYLYDVFVCVCILAGKVGRRRNAEGLMKGWVAVIDHLL